MATVRPAAQSAVPEGFVSLFNGKDLAGWRIPVDDGGHWKVVDGVIDYDAGSQAQKDKNLWTEKSFKNFQLKVDWRIKDTPLYQQEHENRHARLAETSVMSNGREINLTAPDSDSGPAAARLFHGRSSTSGAGRWARGRCMAIGPMEKCRLPRSRQR